MIKILRTLTICMLLIFTGCMKNESRLLFELPADMTSTFRAVYYASDKRGGVVLENVAVITNGKGELKCPTRNPMLIYLYPATGQVEPIVLYAERGDEIKITGTSTDPATWTIEGNDIDRMLSEWRNANADILKKADPAETNKAVAQYVSENPQSPLSPFLLLTVFSRRDDETLFRRLWQSLSGDALDETWSRLAARADIPSGSVATPGRLKSLALRSLANGIDTVRPDSVKAALLFFWNNGLNDRRQRFDSIKALAKEFPDSASRLIADICLDPDSLGWKSPLRSDSLKDVARLWVPAGLADRRIIALGVPRTPFFIVFSPDGHQRYRGDDTSEAFSIFRETIASKPANSKP